jgi:hypothetical protein
MQTQPSHHVPGILLHDGVHVDHVGSDCPVYIHTDPAHQEKVCPTRWMLPWLSIALTGIGRAHFRHKSIAHLDEALPFLSLHLERAMHPRLNPTVLFMVLLRTVISSQLQNPLSTRKHHQRSRRATKLTVAFQHHPETIFWSRLDMAWITVGYFYYLKLTTLLLHGVHCVDYEDVDGSTVSVLKIDMYTKCYEGSHLFSSYFIWGLIAFYSLGTSLRHEWIHITRTYTRIYTYSTLAQISNCIQYI